VTVHFSHGGGPSALQDAGWDKFHCAVGLAAGLLGFGWSAAKVDSGPRQIVRDKIVASLDAFAGVVRTAH